MKQTKLASSWIPDNTLTLRDGRTLGYARYGDVEGRPLLHFHSWPGSRLEARLVAEPAKRAGVHLISVDRPGMGLSDFKTARTLLDWADDVEELADALGLERFAIQGISAGGAYACACAKEIPHRITSLSIIAGLGSFEAGIKGMKLSNRLIFFVARRLPWLMRPFLWATIGRISQHEGKVGRLLLRMASELPEVDQRLFLNPGIRQQLAASVKEAFLQGTRGLAYEIMLISRPWGFELGEIACTDLYLWHGLQDADVPVAMARSLANAIPGCKATFYPEDGHISVPHTHPEEIWEAMNF